MYILAVQRDAKNPWHSQAPVVQRVNSAIHWITYCPVDEICGEKLLQPDEIYTEQR